MAETGVITSTTQTVTQPHPGTCICKGSDVTAAAPVGRSCVAAVANERTWTHHAPAQHPNSRTLCFSSFSEYEETSALDIMGNVQVGKVHFLKLPSTSETKRGAVPWCVTERVQFSWSWKEKWCSRNEVAHSSINRKKKQAADAGKFLCARLCRFYARLFRLGYKVAGWLWGNAQKSIRKQCVGWRLDDSARLHPFSAGTRVFMSR